MQHKKGKKGSRKAANRIKVILTLVILIAIYLNSNLFSNTNDTNTQEYNKPYTHNSNQPLEFPQMSGDEKLINYEGFVVSYNYINKIPDWVAYEMKNYETGGEYTRNGKKFRPDNALPYPQAEDNDYKNSGWARGHMAPAADFKWSDKAMSDTFYFTNCCPQNSSLNGGMWSTLEKKVRDAAVEYNSVWVITGPIVGKNRYGTIGENKIIVPDSFFKALLVHDGSTYHSVAFIMDNCKQKSNMQSCIVNVNQLEERLNLNLFEALDDAIEEKVEGCYTLSIWNL